MIVKNEGGNFEQLKPGTYQAICKGVFDIGTHKNEWQGQIKYQEQIIIVFEVDERMTIPEFAGERFNITGWYTKSLGDRAKLRKHLESWRARPFTEVELKGFELDNIVKANCVLTIMCSSSGKPYIESIGPIMKGQTPLELEKPFEKNVPDWVEKIRERSEERQNKMNDKIDQGIKSLDSAMDDPYKDDESIPF
jgi:hypothetical protein